MGDQSKSHDRNVTRPLMQIIKSQLYSHSEVNLINLVNLVARRLWRCLISRTEFTETQTHTHTDIDIDIDTDTDTDTDTETDTYKDTDTDTDTDT